MTEQEQRLQQTEPPARGLQGAWGFLREWCRRPEAFLEKLKSWLFAEEDEYLCEHHRADAEHLHQRRDDPAIALFSSAVHLCGAAALGLVLYWHVPAVKAWTDHHLRGKKAAAAERAEASTQSAESGEGKDAGPPSFPQNAPNPAPLVAPLPASARTPCIAVASAKRVTLYRADGTELWSRAAEGAIFSPAGDVALLEREAAGWAAVDARTGVELPWSDDVGCVPSSAQVKWSSSSKSVCLEWPVSEDRDRNALAVYDRSKRRWALQTALDGAIGCAVQASWSPDERHLALPAARGTLLFDLGSGARERLPLPGDRAEVLWEPGGRHLVTSGSVDRLAGNASLVRYALDAGVVAEAPVACIGPHAEPLGWMDSGAVVVYRTPCSGSYDGSTIYLAEWPSGDPITRLGDFGDPQISPDGRLVAVYALNSESGGAGELEVTPLDGDPISLDPRPIVGVPLKWLELPDEKGYRYTDEPVLDWALDCAWAPSGRELYLLARRGLHSWCLWRWDVSSRAARPVGREVHCFDSPEEVEEKSLQLVFLAS